MSKLAIWNFLKPFSKNEICAFFSELLAVSFFPFSLLFFDWMFKYWCLYGSHSLCKCTGQLSPNEQFQFCRLTALFCPSFSHYSCVIEKNFFITTTFLCTVEEIFSAWMYEFQSNYHLKTWKPFSIAMSLYIRVRITQHENCLIEINGRRKQREFC